MSSGFCLKLVSFFPMTALERSEILDPSRSPHGTRPSYYVT